MSHMTTFSPSNYILTTSREYAIYVCDTRGIPSVIDGLKTSQRIALWLIRNRADKMKTIGLSGQMASERLYVHGDVSASNAIGLLAAPFKNNSPLIQGEGEFGSRIAPDGIGAPRYTEVRRSKYAEAFLYNDLPDIPLVKNYDGSNMQPLHFVPIIPTVLLNGVTGVAVGFSTEILPRKLQDIVAATLDTLRGKTPKVLVPHYENYDVEVKSIGPNQWENTGRVEIQDSSTLRVTELPPGLTLEKFRKRLIELEEKGEIMDFDDNSAEKINIEVRMKRGSLKGRAAGTEVVDGKKVKVPALPAWTVGRAIEFLKLKEKVTERIVVLDWNLTSIVTYDDPHRLISDFIKFRLNVYVDRYTRLLKDANHDLVYWKLLRALFENGFTKKLGAFADKAAVTTEVNAIAKKAKLKPDADQVDRAVSLPTYRWAKDFKHTIDARIAELEASIVEYQDTLDKPDKIKAIFVSELEALKKLK